jgi:hypothetical protein
MRQPHSILIQDVDYLRDGGSIVIKTNMGVFWWDVENAKVWRNDTVTAQKKNLVEDISILYELIRVLGRDASKFHSIKGYCK